MRAGQTNLLVGTKVQLMNIKGEDRDLNGLKGSVTHPFAFGETKKGWIGVYLEGDERILPYGGKLNIRVSECEIIK
jgi:hypothetical protein